MSLFHPYGLNLPTLYWGTSQIRPSTYDESATFYEQIAHLRRAVQDVIDRNDQDDDKLNSVVAQINSALESLSSTWDAYRAHVEEMIVGANNSAIAWNPTKGTRHEPVSDSIDDVYDNLRVHAMFAKDYDELGLTAQQYDDVGLVARHFDLVGSIALLNLEYNDTLREDMQNG